MTGEWEVTGDMSQRQHCEKLDDLSSQLVKKPLLGPGERAVKTERRSMASWS